MLRRLTHLFELARLPAAALEARVIVREAASLDDARLAAHPETPLSAAAATAARRMAARRLSGEPLAYVLGRREFYSRSFLVTPDVLVPRPETEVLCEEAVAVIGAFSSPPRVADVGTGSGCVAVTVALEAEVEVVYAVDVSAGALAVARENARRLGARRVVPVEGDMLEGFGPGSLDVVVSNPPYVSRAEYEALPEDVRRYEPPEALLGGEDGLECIRRLVLDCTRVLARGGWCLLEVGAGQADRVERMLRRAGFVDVSVSRDLCGVPRVVKAIWRR